MTHIITIMGCIFLGQLKLGGDILFLNEKNNQVLYFGSTDNMGQFHVTFPDSMIQDIAIYYNIKDTLQNIYMFGKGIRTAEHIRYSSIEKWASAPFFIEGNKSDTIKLNINITEKFIPIYLKTNLKKAAYIHIFYPNHCLPINELSRLYPFSVDMYDIKIGAKIRLEPDYYNKIYVPKYSDFNHNSQYHFFFQSEECYRERPHWAATGHLQEVIIDGINHIYMTGSFVGYNNDIFSVFPIGYSIIDLIFSSEPPLTQVNWNRITKYIDKRNSYTRRKIGKKNLPDMEDVYPKKKKR